LDIVSRNKHLNRIRSVKFRLVLFFFVTIFICITATGYFSAEFFKVQYIGELKEKLFEHGRTVEFILEPLPGNEYQKTSVEIARRLGGKSKVRITIIGKDGAVMADSENNPAKMGNHLNRPEIIEAVEKGGGTALRMSDTVHREFLYVARLVKKADGREFFIRVAAPSDYINTTLNHIKITIFLAAVVTLTLSFAFTIIITSRFTGPIERLKNTSEKIAAGDLSARSRLHGEDEFGKLGEAVDEMAAGIQKNIEDLSEKKSEIENILASMKDGVIVTNTERNILLINAAVFEIFKLEKRDYTGAPLMNVIRHQIINEHVRNVLLDGKSRETEIEIHPITKTTIDARIYPFNSQAGGMTGAIIVIRDITKIKKLETVRTEFIENASHELRTPVSLIRGFVETLLSGAMEIENDRQRFLGLLDKESRRLMNLTEDILDLERAEKKKDDKTTANMDAVRELAECAGNFAHSIAEKGLKLETDFPTEPIALKMPKEDFAQIFNNLIDNAVKFTREGTISVIVEKLPDRIAIIVKDTGVGIPSPDRERIFERFYRVDKSRSREMGGTGLGLSIVKHYVEKWGGTVSVESAPGAGSSFRVNFPI
jgi:two-component system, OmpR family, phosphate regulon sensor histidine kinase PhoR